MATVIVGTKGWLGSLLLSRAMDNPQFAPVCDPGRIDVTADPEHWAASCGLHSDDVVINAGGGSSTNVTVLEEQLVRLPLFLASACSRSGARLVHLGSAAEYGPAPINERINESRSVHPVSDYGRAKARASEGVLAHDGGHLVVRIFNLIGWPLTRGTVFDYVARQFLVASDPVLVETPGLDFHRDYLDRLTAVDAVLEIALSQATGLLNLCSGRATSGAQLVDWCADSSGRRAKVSVRQPSDTSWIVGDNTLIAHLLGSSIECDWASVADGFTTPTEWRPDARFTSTMRQASR